MSREYLSEKVWRDAEGTNYIMLDVTDEIGDQQARTIDGVELLPKDEYHVTLVPASKFSEDESVVESVVDEVRAFLARNPDEIVFKELLDERYVCTKGDELTLIAPAVVLGLDALRAVVRRHVPDYAPAFPHVTLLKSANSKYGIGVNSMDDLHEYCRKIETHVE